MKCFKCGNKYLLSKGCPTKRQTDESVYLCKGKETEDEGEYIVVVATEGELGTVTSEAKARGALSNSSTV